MCDSLSTKATAFQPCIPIPFHPHHRAHAFLQSSSSSFHSSVIVHLSRRVRSQPGSSTATRRFLPVMRDSKLPLPYVNRFSRSGSRKSEISDSIVQSLYNSDEVKKRKSISERTVESKGEKEEERVEDERGEKDQVVVGSYSVSEVEGNSMVSENGRVEERGIPVMSVSTSTISEIASSDKISNGNRSSAPSFKDSESSTTPDPALGNGNGDENNNNNDNNNNNNGDDNNDNNEDGDNEEDNERSELIRTLNITDKDATISDLRLWNEATKIPLLGWLASKWPALRNRLGANKRLPLQMGVEVTVGAISKTMAEVQGRGEKFWNEFDFYLSDISLEVFGDIVLVWLLSPVVRQGMLFNSIPKHFSQIGSFGTVGRASAFLVKGVQFGIAGFVSSAAGHGLTRYLVSKRNSKNQGGGNGEEDQVVLAPVLSTSLAWGGFLATSSNVRYQMVNGLEQRILEPLFGGNVAVLTAITFALRFSNCYLGSMQWLPWAKLWDLQ